MTSVFGIGTCVLFSSSLGFSLQNPLKANPCGFFVPQTGLLLCAQTNLAKRRMCKFWIFACDVISSPNRWRCIYRIDVEKMRHAHLRETTSEKLGGVSLLGFRFLVGGLGRSDFLSNRPPSWPGATTLKFVSINALLQRMKKR